MANAKAAVAKVLVPLAIRKAREVRKKRLLRKDSDTRRVIMEEVAKLPKDVQDAQKRIEDLEALNGRLRKSNGVLERENTELKRRLELVSDKSAMLEALQKQGFRAPGDGGEGTGEGTGEQGGEGSGVRTESDPPKEEGTGEGTGAQGGEGSGVRTESDPPKEEGAEKPKTAAKKKGAK